VFHAKVYVTLKKSILDPQGKAVEHGIHSLGFDAVENVRIGKYVEMDVDVPTEREAETVTKGISEQLLANLVMEGYSYSIEKKAE
jgi:phosphoribosylformylglycinamidine synthase